MVWQIRLLRLARTQTTSIQSATGKAILCTVFFKILAYTVLTIMFRALSIVSHHYRTNNLKSLIKIDCDSFFSAIILQLLEGFLNKNIEEEGP